MHGLDSHDCADRSDWAYAAGSCSMTEYVRRHWIPSTYLEAWCDPDVKHHNPRRAYRYTVDGRYKDWRTPKRMFTESDLYTVRSLDGYRDITTEKALSRLEGSISSIRKHYLDNHLPLPPTARKDLLSFISALHNRSPAMHAHQAALWNRLLEIAKSTKNSLQALSPGRAATVLEAPRSLSGTTPHKHRNSLGELREVAARQFGAYVLENMAIETEILEQMHLVIICIPAGRALVTSDRPVVLWDPQNPLASGSRLGLARRTIEITVPLTPRLCAQISHRRGPDYADTDAEGEAVLNLRTLNRASEVFVANSQNLVVDWLDEGDRD